jgi:catechol 2,3-dioxygenase-like lactoylglutathione lyase family enzyme
MNKKLAIAAMVCLLGTAIAAQTARDSRTQPGLVIGSGNFFSPVVANLEKAIQFYRDGLELEVAAAPSNADENAPLRNMFGLPDARIRWIVGRPPGMRGGVEMVEISKPGQKPADRRIQDVGAFTLVVFVRDLDAAFARMKRVGAVVVTSGGGPVSFAFGNGTTRGVIVKDPDGHFVELVQADAAAQSHAPPSANVVGVRVRVTVNDAAQTLHVYRDVLGLQQASFDQFKKDANISAMLGITGGQFRLGSVQVPGSGLTVAFVEFKDVDRKTVRSNLEDPGSTRMQLQVRDISAAIAGLQSAGGTVVSTGGGPVELPGRAGGPATKVAIVRDLNNLFVVLIQPPPAPAAAANRE